mmetsp:Transcript_26057/g.18515  ORF Transcript_26057/g.18515 Transcript_26057/m.18515 type:complete len:84 (-) Transcript_26057:879-1130(-)
MLNPSEYKYIKFYGDDLFQNMLDDEIKYVIPCMLESQQFVTPILRASLIDWMYDTSYKIGVKDRQAFYQAVYLLDRYYETKEF